MCEPVTIGALTLTATETMMASAAAVAVASTAVSVAAQRSQAAAAQSSIDAAAKIRATQVSNVAGQQESVAAKSARQARAESVVAAGESGINLGSNSFLASMQTTAMTQSDNNGLILENEKNQQLGDQATVQSELNTQAYSPSIFGGAVSSGLAGAGAFMSAYHSSSTGTTKGIG